VLDCVATDVDDRIDDPRFGPMARQRCRDKPASRHLASDISSEFDICGSGLIEHDGLDPHERHGGQKADDLAMRMGIAWGGQVCDLIGEHMKSPAAFPPRKKGGSLRER